MHERPSLAFGSYGDAVATRVITSTDALFFELKGTLEDLLSRFVIEKTSFDANSTPPWLEPGRGAQILVDGVLAGWFGALTTSEREARKLKEHAVLGELLLPVLYACALRQPLAKEPSRFQAVERDLSFLFSAGVQWGDVERALRGLNIVEMISLQPVEIFRDSKGKSVQQGEYSLLLRMVFQSGDHTLREEQLTTWQDAAIAALVAIGGKHRAS